MNLPQPGPQYDVRNEAQTRQSIEAADKQNRKSLQDVEIGRQRLILKSPDGSRWSITVDNLGALSATAL